MFAGHTFHKEIDVVPDKAHPRGPRHEDKIVSTSPQLFTFHFVPLSPTMPHILAVGTEAYIEDKTLIVQDLDGVVSICQIGDIKSMTRTPVEPCVIEKKRS